MLSISVITHVEGRVSYLKVTINKTRVEKNYINFQSLYILYVTVVGFEFSSIWYKHLCSYQHFLLIIIVSVSFSIAAWNTKAAKGDYSFKNTILWSSEWGWILAMTLTGFHRHVSLVWVILTTSASLMIEPANNDNNKSTSLNMETLKFKVYHLFAV